MSSLSEISVTAEKRPTKGRSEMNEKIYKRNDRNRCFDHRTRTCNMDYCKLGRRNIAQHERLFVSIMESVHNALSVIGGKDEKS